MKKLSERKKKWIERTIANNRSYKVWLYNRLFLFLLLVVLQIVGYVFLMYMFTFYSDIAVGMQITIGVLEMLFSLYIINRYERPAVKLAWILLILVVPVVGVPAFLMFGEGRSATRMRKRISAEKAENEKNAQEILGETPSEYADEDTITKYIADCGPYPVYYEGDVQYYKSGEDMFPVMLSELRKAKKYILVEYFIIAHGKMWNSVLEILLKKAMEGVQIRILYDDFGCMVTLPPDYDRYLESLHENIRCASFNHVVPLFAVRMNNRDHRKILVIDGEVGFTGGINLADEYIGEIRRFGHWKDTGVKIVGPAVNSFIKMFFYLWNAAHAKKENVADYLLPYTAAQPQGEKERTLRIQPYDDSPLDSASIGESVYADIIARAKKYVYIFTPYLILDDFIRNTLCLAAQRGVDVRIVTPGVPDKKTVYRLTRANYEVLMDAGVKIYEYTPGFIHAKSMVADDEVAVVGTINLDYRSLFLHFENAVYFTGTDAVMDVKRDSEETFAISELCTKESIKRGFFRRLIDSFLRLFETLF